MDNLLTTTPVVNGTFHWFMGDKRVGWIAGDDLAAVSARILADGPKKHAGKRYWLSTEVLNGSEAAAEIAQALQQTVECVVMTPDCVASQAQTVIVKVLFFCSHYCELISQSNRKPSPAERSETSRAA